jgi:hypothetical protein
MGFSLVFPVKSRGAVVKNAVFVRIEIVTLVGITIPVWLECRQRRPAFSQILLH